MGEQTAIDRAIQALGSQQALADFFGVSKAAVNKWRKRVPAERVLGIEQATGGVVTRYQLRPDLYPREQDTAA